MGAGRSSMPLSRMCGNGESDETHHDHGCGDRCAERMRRWRLKRRGAQECRQVTNTTGDIVDGNGKVLIPGASRTFELCCAAGFVTVITPDLGGLKGNSTTSCKV